MDVQVSVRFELDESILQMLDEAADQALKQTADATLTAIREAGVMPRDTGNLQNDATEVIVSGTGGNQTISIVSSPIYAKRLYFHPEYNFNRTKNARAGGKWFEPWLTGSERTFIEETYAEMLRRNGGL